MGNTAVLLKLADENGRSMEVYDAHQAAAFLKNYTDALSRPAVATGSVQTSDTYLKVGELLPRYGGYFAGICRGIDGAPDYYLYVHPDAKDAGKWDAAVDWAKGLTHEGQSDYALPTRREQAVLFGNVPELFKPEYYWSGEQYASDPDAAWVQGFNGGTQDTHWKYGSYRARAVRRSPV